MKARYSLLFVVLAVVATSVLAGDVILPTFAWNNAGKGVNNWSSEVYLTNPGPEAIRVTLADVYVGKIKEMTPPCLHPSPVRVDVPAYSTVAWKAANIAIGLGCPESALVGLLLSSEGYFVVNSRMVNTFASQSTSVEKLLTGLSQEVPGVPVEQLLQSKTEYMVPGLGWEPAPCGAVQFDNYLQIVNPNDETVTITLAVGAGSAAGELMVDGVRHAAPYALELKGRSWRQVKVGPAPRNVVQCEAAALDDVFVSVSAPVSLYASVVDRKSQDPRTMLPVQVIQAP